MLFSWSSSIAHFSYHAISQPLIQLSDWHFISIYLHSFYFHCASMKPYHSLFFKIIEIFIRPLQYKWCQISLPILFFFCVLHKRDQCCNVYCLLTKNSLTSNWAEGFLDLPFSFCFFAGLFQDFPGHVMFQIFGWLGLTFPSGVVQDYLNCGSTCYGEKNYHLCISVCMHNDNSYDFWKKLSLLLHLMICFFPQIFSIVDQSALRQHDNVPHHYGVFPWHIHTAGLQLSQNHYQNVTNPFLVVNPAKSTLCQTI